VSAVFEWVVSGGVLVAVGATAVRGAVAAERRAQLRVLARVRARRGEHAAAVAGIDDPAFAPETIRASVQAMLATAEGIWRRGSSNPRKSLGNPRNSRREHHGELIQVWAEGWGRQLGVGLRIVGKPQIDILRVINRGSEDEDRAVLRVRLRIHRDPKASLTQEGDGTLLGQRIVVVEERWTLVRRGDRWALASVDGDPIARAVISAPLIASPDEDEGRVRQVALQELADEEAPHTVDLGELIDRNAAAPQRLRQLAILDDHFAPELLEATLRRVVEGWEELTYGSQRPLEKVAAGTAVQALMYGGGGRGRHFIRDAELLSWEALDVSTSGTPELRLRVEIKGEISTDGRPTAGGGRRRKHTLIWTLRLFRAAGGDTAWRLVSSSEPSA